MNIGNIVGFIAMAVAVILAVQGEWGWAVGVFLGGAALGALVNMVVAAGMRAALRDSDNDRP